MKELWFKSTFSIFEAYMMFFFLIIRLFQSRREILTLTQFFQKMPKNTAILESKPPRGYGIRRPRRHRRFMYSRK